MSAAIIVVLSILLYLLPSIVASRRNHLQATPIFIINLLTGWTGIGWVLALAWAFAAKDG